MLFLLFAPLVTLLHAQEQAEASSYQFSFKPSISADLLLEWSINNDQIDVRFTRSDKLAWFALGLCHTTSEDPPPHLLGNKMYQADFWISMVTRNYTGTYDLYGALGGSANGLGDGNLYPCWDVLTNDCGGFPGSDDIFNDTITRNSGITVATYSRKLNTGDGKDMAITSAGNKVMFAVGGQDFLYQHKDTETYKHFNFFTGKVGLAEEKKPTPRAVHQSMLAKTPVFIRHEGRVDTKLPTSYCLPCRGDQEEKCLSAVVECNPDGSVTETLFADDSCDEEPTTVNIYAEAPDNIYCTPKEETSPWNLDLDRFIDKLLLDEPDIFNEDVQVADAIEEYRRMLSLIQLYPEMPVVPSKQVDMVWHAHILDTTAYRRDMSNLYGRYIDHAPSFDPDPESEEKMSLKDSFTKMMSAYDTIYGKAPKKVWSDHYNHDPEKANQWLGCCSFFCVKPICTQCTGCSSTDCGSLKNYLHWRTDLPLYVPL